jgi:3'-phosphoadenosine 5'-phosphosulfate sulfotransferase (PAPS reductase)/FAD synthetase
MNPSLENTTLRQLGGGNDTITIAKRQNFLEHADDRAIQKFTRGGKTTSIENSEELASILNKRMKEKSGGQNQRLAIMLGWLTKEQTIKANIPNEDRSQFSQTKYKFFLEAKFEISNRCCTEMKKNPAHEYHKRTGRNPITAQMASESRLRTQKWIQNGCNGFHLSIPTSNPMSFWTEQDVLQYIYERKLPICSVYGEVVEDFNKEGKIEGQMSLLENDKPILKTTGCKRTGCMLCGFGCHMKDDNRFLQLKETHPKMYGLLDVCKNNGVTFREAIEWTNEHGNLNIRL